MFTSRFFRSLFLPYLLLICVATGAVGAFAAYRLRDSYLQKTRQSLHNETILVSGLLDSDLSASHLDRVQSRAKAIALTLACRITVVDIDGKVLADTDADPAHMENHHDRPEIMRADVADEGESIRLSATVGIDSLYLARKFTAADGKAYFVRLSVHLADLDAQLRLLYEAMAGVVVLSATLAAAIGFYFAGRHTAPVRELANFAQALAAGDMHRRILTGGKGEIAVLTSSLNAMADSLTSLLDTSEQNRAELLAIITSMSDGVIATDVHQRVVLVNQKASELLGFEFAGAQDRPLWELVPSEPILRAAGEVLARGERATFQVSPAVGRYLEVAACTFPATGPAAGLVLVAHDTTRSVRYQELRKEFVANVSHELRTPLTVIKGFTETLMDGALSDPVVGPKFLATIQKHVDQLTNLVNDLLELSKLEGLPDLPRPVRVDLAGVARRAVDLLQPASQKKHQTVGLDISGGIPRVLGNPDYLERAVSNLIDNAIKYTPDGGNVQITVGQDNGHVTVEVADNGLGIPADDLPRIFERFYRVDRSRSREMGGTGLGLSIVKHVAQVHGGSIDVTSSPGAGSKFKLKIPVPVEG